MSCNEEETVRAVLTVLEDGRLTIPRSVRKIVGIDERKAFCQVENYGKDKILLTILNRWQPPEANRGIRTKLG